MRAQAAIIFPYRLAYVVPLVLLCCSALRAQSGNSPFWLGYDLPMPPPVAPGSVISLFVQNVGQSLTGPVTAASLPLPRTLAGISVSVSQDTGPSQPIAAPILAVRPISACASQPPGASGVTCSGYTAITIQIPFEIRNRDVLFSRLVVSENGVAGRAIEISPTVDSVHMLTACDVNGNFLRGCEIGGGIVVHADGTVAGRDHPAGIGEELVMYAFGLGATTPSVPTGLAASGPTPASYRFRLNFDYRPNAPPSYSDPQSQVAPVYAGLTPGYAGLYQINFVVPPPPPGTPACNSVPLCVSNPACVATNLTVSLIGAASFDGGGLCVNTTATASSTTAASMNATTGRRASDLHRK